MKKMSVMEFTDGICFVSVEVHDIKNMVKKLRMNTMKQVRTRIG